jgi:replicative DNA helicase
MPDPSSWNPDAEVGLVSALLLDPSRIVDVVDVVRLDDFRSRPVRIVYEALRDLHDLGQPTDLVALGEHLSRDGRLASIGGAEALSRLAERAISTAFVPYHAQTVREHGTRREALSMIEKKTESLSRLPLGLKDRALEDALVDLSGEVWKLGRALRSERREARETRDVVREVLEDLVRSDAPTGFGVGLYAVDDVVSFRPSELTVLGGRPGDGKSAALFDFAVRVAKSGRDVFAVSAEMSLEQVGTRILAREAEVPGFKLLQRRMTEDERRRLARASEDLRDLPLTLWEAIRARPQDVRAEALRRQREGKLDLIVVDYLQRLRPPRDRREAKRYQEVGEVAQELKEMARELGVPVLTAAQLGRDSTGRKPELSDLRESGDIEQEADNVGLLWKPTDEQNLPRQDQIAILWRKQRMGPTGESLLGFDRATSKLSDPSLVGGIRIDLGGDEALPDFQERGER